MKKIRHILYIVCVLCTLSCVEDEIPSDGQLADRPYYLTVEKSSLSFGASQNLVDFVDINSKNVSWEITGAPDWLTLSVTSGTGTAAVKVTASENRKVGEARSALLTVRSTSPGYQFQKTIAVSQSNLDLYINGHEYVDLGLPSGIKWATCNVGASKPEEYGGYYAWGETSTKSDYSESTSSTYGKEMSDIGGNAQYDVARKQWGSTWRMPTKAEFQELIDNCTWQWTTQNGVNGMKVTSKSNGASIFLPAAGRRRGTSLYSTGSDGSYWSSTPYEGNTGYAYGLYFLSGDHSTYWYYRYSGHSVRPVSE